MCTFVRIAAKVRASAKRGSSTSVLMDGGDGNLRTNEGLARVVKGIANRAAKNEVCADNSTLDAMSGMLTHDERKALFGPENIL